MGAWVPLPTKRRGVRSLQHPTPSNAFKAAAVPPTNRRPAESDGFAVSTSRARGLDGYAEAAKSLVIQQLWLFEAMLEPIPERGGSALHIVLLPWRNDDRPTALLLYPSLRQEGSLPCPIRSGRIGG